MENGQYEVSSVAGGAIAAPAPKSEEAPREDSSRRGRSRRGRGRERERAPEGSKEEAQPRQPPREPRPDGALSLARAFQLLSRALGELRPPVGHEALRLRMAALHGRQDPLLGSPRFARFLRQANDAEAADVRKVGDDEYEISPHRTGATPAAGGGTPVQPATSAQAASETVSVPAKPAAAEAAGATRGNGQRLGVRFRRGSRSPLRAAEVPLIGVVEIDVPAAPAPSVEHPAATSPDAAAKPARPRRAPRKRAAVTAEAPAPPDDVAAPPPKRPRARSRKKKAE
jgi:hypothetical protein